MLVIGEAALAADLITQLIFMHLERNLAHYAASSHTCLGRADCILSEAALAGASEEAASTADFFSDSRDPYRKG